MNLHEFLDCHYGLDGDDRLRQRLAQGDDPNVLFGGETPLHVAARRCRASAVAILLDHGADIDACNRHGKTAFAHSVRRGFKDIDALLVERGADTTLNAADRLAVQVVNGRIDDALAILEADPGCVRTGNPEEDRLLADVAGRNDNAPVALLIQAGADLTAPALDTGTPLHQAAWFGQPRNARLLIDAGAPLDVFDQVHRSSPIGWAVHGAGYSGDAEERQDLYVELVQMLIDAGSSLKYPDDPNGNDYLDRLRNEATPSVRAILPESP